MGTIVTFDAYFYDSVPHDAYEVVRRAGADLHHNDEVFSTYKKDSPLSRLRGGVATLGSMPVEVHDVLDICRSAREMSGGWFDPWSMEGGVDPSGLVKGWAAQRAGDVLKEGGIDNFIVNAAGDIATKGDYFGVPFRIGIVDPRDSQRFFGVVELAGAMATSGTYERGEHLYNPFSKRYACAVAAGTVRGEDLAQCDALATALCLGGDEVFSRIEKMKGYEALMIRYDGSWAASEGMAFTVV